MIDDPNFSLDLGRPWQQVPCDDPEQHNFRDDARDVIVALSAMALDIAPEAIDQFTGMLVKLRLKAEGDTAQAFAHHATIYEPIVVPQPWGRAVVYYGHDDSGRQFGFSGMVTRRSMIGLYMSSGRLSERELMEAMDEIGSKIAFDRTPLEVCVN